MSAPTNNFKASLNAGKAQVGFWLALANAYTAEIAGQAGFDWLLLDGEHGPNDIPLLVAQLQALSTSSAHIVVRVPIGETWMIKQVLDIGAQTILVPMVESALQARELVRAMLYSPHGIRGVGASIARASKFNALSDYVQTANEQVCLLLQVESAAGLAAIEEIGALDGVDGIFIGPADLAADLGYLGKVNAPEVQSAVEDGLKRIVATGKAAGILTSDHAHATRYLELGATFVAVGNDVLLFSNAAQALAQKFIAGSTTGRPSSAGY